MQTGLATFEYKNSNGKNLRSGIKADASWAEKNDFGEKNSSYESPLKLHQHDTMILA